MKKVLIVGSNFNNKGAQSMLFVTVDELKKRMGNVEIFFATEVMQDGKNFVFKQLYYTEIGKWIALRDFHRFPVIFKYIVKNLVKSLLGKDTDIKRIFEVNKFMPSFDLVLDVSGFKLGKKWGVLANVSYLDNIRLAKKYKIPMYLMPQSFGPFDFPSNCEYLLTEIKDLLSYPNLIFAREKEGFHLLQSNFGLQNVKLSTDLVLQHRELELSNLFRKPQDLNLPPISSDSAIGIVPNNQCFVHGNKDKNLKIYDAIIHELLLRKKVIYLFRHSTEDYPICEELKKHFSDVQSVHLLAYDFSCIAYDEFVKNFEFIICSRYHGIVHAYKNGIPCIALGWAVKYEELAENVGQSKYAFDITDEKCTEELVVQAVRSLMDNENEEKKMIQHKVTEIQNNNCFDEIAWESIDDRG